MKTYSNPAFAALGIKQFKLPSRNWMIFWTVLGTLSGGIVYDKWQQRILRDEYMKKYENTITDFDVLIKPRKLRIYISPPPNDYLDESLKYFRRFVKPIINSSGLDFEIITMDRQGDVRYKVAEEIRQIRRKLAGIEEVTEEKIVETGASTSIAPNSINPVFASIKSKTSELDDEKPIKSVKELYKPMDVLGVERFFGDFEARSKSVKSEDALVSDVRNAGGVICIGRGAYKEYINGIHEGLLGPLEKPEEPIIEPKEKMGVEDEDPAKVKEEKKKTEEGEEGNKYAPEPYVVASDYNNLSLAKEFGLDVVDWNDDTQVSRVLQELRDTETGMPYFFTQPVLELRNYNVAGFTRQPERIWRFYHKRNQLIEYNERIVGLIQKKWCAFTGAKIDAGVEEEFDWPSSWLKTAKKNNSEWVREFKGDERVIKLLSSYNCDCNDSTKKD